MDLINNPPHYAAGRQYETIDVLERFFPREPLLWQVGKYLSRYGRKGKANEDLSKARWYIERRYNSSLPVMLQDPIIYDQINPILADWYGSQTWVPDDIRTCTYKLLTIPCSENQFEASKALNACRNYIIHAEGVLRDFR